MGHKRYGYLPKSTPWILLVEEIDNFSSSSNINNISEIAKQTLQNVQKRFDGLKSDPSIYATFEYLLKVSKAFTTENPLKFLKENGIADETDISVIKLGRSLKRYKTDEADSKEYQTFAYQAGIDALNKWYKANVDSGITLFSDGIDNEFVFSKMGDAGKFSDLARYYLSNFTERYLKYYLERTASQTITNIAERERFNKAIENHVDDISKHAFETTKITQSLIAALFNRYIKSDKLNKKEVKNFLSFSFDKMKGELLREEDK